MYVVFTLGTMRLPKHCPYHFYVLFLNYNFELWGTSAFIWLWLYILDRKTRGLWSVYTDSGSDSGLCCSQQDGPSLPTGHHSGLHTSSTTPLCCHRPSRPSCQPCNCLSLVPTAELLHPRSLVVERSPHPHKNCSRPAHLPPQLEDSSLHSVPWLLFGSFLIYCPFPITVLSPCIFLFSTYKLYLSWHRSLTCIVW